MNNDSMLFNGFFLSNKIKYKTIESQIGVKEIHVSCEMIVK